MLRHPPQPWFPRLQPQLPVRQRANLRRVLCQLARLSLDFLRRLLQPIEKSVTEGLIILVSDLTIPAEIETRLIAYRTMSK